MLHKISRMNFRRWKMILLIVVALLVLTGVWLEREQASLTNDVLRLHVLANSDTKEDQELKLKVRDRVLEEAEKILPDDITQTQAEALLVSELERLAKAGALVVEQEGYSYPVRAEITETWFPTKQYEEFALPAGQYRALRIVIGDGTGENWWCVVFPPLCLGSTSESVYDVAASSGMNERQVALLTAETEGYVIKFKALEIWESIKCIFS